MDSSITIGNNTVDKKSFNDLFSDDAISKYLTTKNVDEKDIEPITNWVHQLQDGINNGKIKYDGNTARVYDTAYAVHDNLGQKYQSIALGVIKDFSKNAAPVAATASNTKSSGIETVTDNTPEVKKPQKFQFGFLDNLKKTVSKGNPEVVAATYDAFVKNPNWDVLKQAYNSYKDYIDKGDFDFSDTTFKDKAAYQAELANLGAAIEHKDSKTALEAATAIGEPDLSIPINAEVEATQSTIPQATKPGVPVKGSPEPQKPDTSKSATISQAFSNGFDWNKLTPQQKLDLAGFATDLVSLGSAFVPGYGTAVSALTGAASSFMSYANGRSDFKGLLGNLGLDATGAIPYFGIAPKVRKISKVAQWVLPVISASLSQDARNAFEEISKGNVNKNNVATLTSALLPLLPAAARIGKNAAIARKVDTGAREIQALDNKSVQLTKEQLKNVKNIKGKEAQSAMINKLTGNDVKLGHNLNNTFFNFFNNKVSKVAATPITDKGNVAVAKRFSNSGIATRGFAQAEDKTKAVKTGRFRSYKDTGDKYKAPTSNVQPKHTPASTSTTVSPSVAATQPATPTVSVQTSVQPVIPPAQPTVQANVQPTIQSTTSTVQPVIPAPTASTTVVPPIKNIVAPQPTKVTTTKKKVLTQKELAKLSKKFRTKRTPKKEMGGIIFKAQTGVKTSASWIKDMDPLITPSILFGLDNDKNLYKQLNNIQDSYYGVKSQAGDNFENTAYKSPQVGAHQTAFNNVLSGLGNNFAVRRLEDSDKFTFAKGANTTDKPIIWTDNLFSGITNLRYMLGKQGDFTPAEEAQRKAAFAKKGYDWYLDTNGMYKLKPISDNPLNEVVKTKLNADLNSPIPMGNIKPTSLDSTEPTKTPWYNNIANNLADHLGTLRFLNNLWYNSRIKPKYVGAYETPVEYNAKVMYDLPSQMAYNLQAAEANRLGALTASADQTQNTARALQYNTVANGLKEKGQLANKEKYDSSTEYANKLLNANTENRVKVADTNAKIGADIQNAKEAFRLAQSKQINNNFDNFLQEIEKKAANNKEILKGIDMEAAKHFYSTELEGASSRLQNAEREYKIKNPSGQWLDSQEYLNAKKAYDTELSQIGEKFYQQIHAMGPKSLSPLFRRGGSISEATQMIMHNDDEFNKMIRFKVSESNKMIRQLSNFSAKLIFDSLKWK